MERLFLIDGSSFCYRAFYAIRELSTSKGQPTNAIYGVVTMLKKLVEEERPEYLAVAFDLPEPTFRHRRFEAYKEHRKPMPEALVSQIPWIKQVLRALRIPIFEQPGYEADDILGTLAVGAARQGLEVVLVTGDKDLFQLLGPRVKVYRPTRDGHEVIDERSLSDRWQLRPDQVVDVMALMGDEIDAIPGVPGIGEKTAVELIQRFGSVEQLLKDLKEVPGAVRRASIEKHSEQLKLSRELVLLDTEVPVPWSLSDLKRTEPDRETLRELFQTFEFRTLLKDLTPEGSSRHMEVSPLEADGVAGIVSDVRREGRLALSVMSEGSHPSQAEVTGVGLAWVEGAARVLVGPDSLAALRGLLEDPKVVKICANLKETLGFLGRNGFDLRRMQNIQGSWTDPCLASYLLDPARPSHRVSALSAEFLGESIEHTDPAQAAALEAEAALRLMPRLEQEIGQKELSVLLEQVEIPLSLVLARMEAAGIGVDRSELSSLSKEMDRTLERLTEKIYSLAGGSFNINSPKQLAQVLFERLKLPVVKKTKTGASTDEGVLQRLSSMHELPAAILEYREMFKLSSTYVEALPRLIHPKTGRIHACLNQTVTATGRLSCSEPNLQNIPIRTELGRQIRRAFVPSDAGKVLLAADYSQIELRILAHISGDETLAELFRKGEDVHRVTAAEIFRVSVDEVTPDQRAVAKTINFGIVYGMSPFGLAKELGIDLAQAEAFIHRYFARYHGVQDYLTRSLEQARANGYCVTLFHRRRYIPELTSRDITVRQFAERTAINAPIQGSAADLIKVAMVALDRELVSRGLGSRMILQVHDELIFEVPLSEREQMRRLVKETMEAPPLEGKRIRLSVPIEVKFKEGRNWLEASVA